MSRILLSASALALATAAHAQSFNRIASFDVSTNSEAGAEVETSAEIIAVTDDGMTLIYTDSPLEAVGAVDISDPANPAPLGVVALDGEPTSVALAGARAFVGINTSESYTAPSGYLAAHDIPSFDEVARCDLGGQPDSVAASPDGAFIAVAIENERDEDLNDGIIPQLPAGNVTIIPTTAEGLDCDGIVVADLTGLADVAPSDPEPEYVAFNDAGEIAVSLQENNHIVVLNTAGEVLSHFTAGVTTLEGIDTEEEGALLFTDTQADRPREPDTIAWIGNDLIATADEGDYEGGSRGWTVFDRDGSIVYDDGLTFEYAAVQVGHYPEERSGNKGVEPEALAVATYSDIPMVFVGAERASLVAAYAWNDGAAELAVLIPSGIGPEAIVPIPDRNLLVTGNEVDLIEDGGVRAHIMVFEWDPEGTPNYPSITSAGADELIGFGALSGLVADANEPGILYAVNDSFYGMQPSIFHIDATQTPAQIFDVTRITREGGAAAQKMDMEGIALDGEGGFWIASEGRTGRLIPHAIYHVDADGEIQDEIAFPAELLAVERRFGSEGITTDGEALYIAIQREWADDADNTAKIVRYDLETEEWTAAAYPKMDPETGWVGLSEITYHDGDLYIIERDNQIGSNAVLKSVYRVALDSITFAPVGEELTVVEKELVVDLMPALAAPMGYIVDKPEGFAIDAAGEMFAVTDNDGVDDSSGETHFLRLGPVAE